VSLHVRTGESVIATLDKYTVTFSFLGGPELEIVVTDPSSTPTTVKSGGTTAAGSVDTADGQLQFSCAP
jgi:hypothetical protein